MPEILYIKTTDDLQLQGIHYLPADRDCCVLFVHGMGGNCQENYFAHVLGERLAAQGFGFLFGHNRGYNHINDISTTELSPKTGYTTKRLGVQYERFAECLLDIDAWLAQALQLGYRQLILCGHSLGCNKVLYYIFKRQPEMITGVALLSPPDMLAMFEIPAYQPNHPQLLEQAGELVGSGKPRELVDGLIWDWYQLSAQTYLDLTGENGPVDNLPVRRNPADWEQLASVNVPILGIMGEHDDIVVRTMAEDMALIKSKATNCPQFTDVVIPAANHMYHGQEELLAQVVTNWLQTVCLVSGAGRNLPLQ